MKVFVVGDSISMQYGPYLARNLRGFATYARKGASQEKELDLDRPSGANGGDSAMVLAYLKASIEGGNFDGAFDADLLLVNCGLHDIKTNPTTGDRQVSLTRYRSNLQSIVDLVSQRSPQLIWVRTTPCDELVHNQQNQSFHRFAQDVADYNAAADEIMANAGVPVIDLYSFTNNLGTDLYCDHVHFHETVREQQAGYIAGWISGYRLSQNQ